MAKRKDSLEEFAFVKQIGDVLPEKKTSKTIVKKEVVLEKRVGEGSATLENTAEKKQQGKQRGQFVMDLPEELTSSIKNVSIFTDVHEELIDLVYYISKHNKKIGKNRVSLLGVTNVALMKGVELLKKEYNL